MYYYCLVAIPLISHFGGHDRLWGMSMTTARGADTAVVTVATTSELVPALCTAVLFFVGAAAAVK